MNKTNVRISFWIALLLLLIGLFFLATRRGRFSSTSDVSGTQQVVDSSSDVPSTDVETNSASRTSTANPTDDRTQQLKAAVDFWGRVVDQEDLPLSGVKVRLSVRKWFITSPTGFGAGFPTTDLVTDDAGNFELIGGHGDTLTIQALERDGYEAEPMALRTFGYNVSTNIVPDPERPVLLRMWKTDQREPLVAADKRFSIVPDGRVYTINFEKASCQESKTKDGDIWFSISRPLEIQFGQRYDWSFRIEVIDGGIVEEKDPVTSMFMAPKQGYVKVYEFNKRVENTGWSHMSEKRFFAQSREQNRHARMSIFVSASSGNIHFRYAMNPSGSRILR